jgi:hypothetical protein
LAVWQARIPAHCFRWLFPGPSGRGEQTCNLPLLRHFLNILLFLGPLPLRLRLLEVCPRVFALASRIFRLFKLAVAAAARSSVYTPSARRPPLVGRARGPISRRGLPSTAQPKQTQRRAVRNRKRARNSQSTEGQVLPCLSGFLHGATVHSSSSSRIITNSYLQFKLFGHLLTLFCVTHCLVNYPEKRHLKL